MDSENKEKVAATCKKGLTGKAVGIACAMLLALSMQTGCSGGGGGGGGGGDWQYSGKDFRTVFGGFPKDEGEVYCHDGGVKVMQATKKGNLVKTEDSDRVVWVETKRRYEDGEPLDRGYYIRRGSMEYETAMGAEKMVARYVEVTGRLLAKVEKQVVAGLRAGETKTITLPGGVKMEMAWCPAGTFMMGSRNGDSDEQPVHEVTLTTGFWMAKTEVTQAQWKSVMGKNPSAHEGDNLPVECVSWADCQEFCEKTGLSLPTEAEWEYACRAGTTGDYGGTGRLEDMGWYDDNSGGNTHPVGQKRANAWGLHDMHGNVWEWCADWYGDYPSGAVTDPTGAGSGGDQVLRGGCSGDNASYCRSAFRRRFLPGFWPGNSGFRPVARPD
ncbi:MAG: formylglycine-generating enzyme family protein [Kiritimatiellae bacterium]|nr:formylglycine-generating enzyme family protein [Kiritimatiellia bacterium]